jgi:hypothetical protein
MGWRRKPERQAIKETKESDNRVRPYYSHSRDYLAGLRSWGLRRHDLVMVNGAGSYVDSWHPEPGDAE